MLYLYCYFEVTSDMYSIHHYFVITSVNAYRYIVSLLMPRFCDYFSPTFPSIS